MAAQSLDKTAWDYLMSSPSDQLSLRNTLINAGMNSIIPLLHAGVRALREFNPLKTRDVKHFDYQVAENIWIFEIAEPVLASVRVVVDAIGQPAYDSLCRVFWDNNEHLKVFAAIILIQASRPSPRTIEHIRKALNYIAYTKKNDVFKNNVFIALYIFLVNNKEIEDFIKEENAIDKTYYSLLLDFFKMDDLR